MEAIKETNNILEIIDYWSNKYEFNFQFWGEGNNNVYIYKGGVDLYNSGQHEKPLDCMKDAIKYINKINGIRS